MLTKNRNDFIDENYFQIYSKDEGNERKVATKKNEIFIS